jgi:hypothetical protein
VSGTLALVPSGSPHSLLADVAERNADVKRIRRELDRTEQALREAVVAARDGGASWQQIAKHLGRSTQTVWERYHDEADLQETATERPRPATARAWSAGDRVLAYHPRLHPELAAAEVVRDFANGVKDRYVAVLFDDRSEPLLTHKANVFAVSGSA